VRGGLLNKKKKEYPDGYVPFFMFGNEERYFQVSPVDRAILMMNEWQKEG